MKKLLSLTLALSMAVMLFAGCNGGADDSAETPTEPTEVITMQIAGMRGPTTMGMVKLMEDSANGETIQDYQVTMYGTADEIVPKLIQGEIDMAAVPANLASVLYNQTDGAVQVLAINTLGVLYMVETGDSIATVENLRGKTIYTTGKGTTPEYVLTYILEENGLTIGEDVTVEYFAEATEVAARLAEADDAIAMLPQPYVTAVQAQNPNIRIALNMTEEWDNVSNGSSLLTGVIVARTAFIEENPQAVQDFLTEYESSINYVNANTEEAAALAVQYEIVAAEPIAIKALPFCNITYIDGADMQAKLGGYLEVLYNQNPQAVGGTLPDEAFYYKKA